MDVFVLFLTKKKDLSALTDTEVQQLTVCTHELLNESLDIAMNIFIF